MAGTYSRWDGYVLFIKQLDGLANLDYTPLMKQWRDIITEDNRAKVLSGQDKDGNPAPALRYRGGGGVATKFRPRANPLSGRTGGRLKLMAQPLGRFKGKDIARGPKVLANNNLTIEEYKKLTGPYGAPRRDSSRIISNLVGADTYHDGTKWIAMCEWRDVIDEHGKPFLQRLFRRYPIDGVRPVGREKARAMMRAFVKSAIQGKA